MSKQKLTSTKIEEYRNYIHELVEIFDDLPDGAFLSVMEEETRKWLKENHIKANALDFYLKHS